MKSALSLFAAVALLGSALSVAGCEDDSFTQTKSTNVSVVPASLDYDPEAPGRQSVARVIQIRQDGETQLRVSAIYLESPDFSEANRCDRVSLGLGRNDPLPASLAEGCHFVIEDRAGGRAFPWLLGNNESLQVNVAYRSIGDTGSWRLVVESNALGRERVEVPLRVRREQPEWGGMTTLAFVNASGGPAQTEFGVIRNSGSGLLDVSGFRVEYLTPQPVDPVTQTPVNEFRVVADSELPWAVDNQTAQTYTVTYTPVDEVADVADLVFTSQNATEPEFRVRLTSQPVFSVIEVQPNPAVFGVPRPPERDRRVVLSVGNRGLKSLNVQSILIDQPGNDYSIEEGNRSFQLRAGATQELRLLYRPTSPDGSDASLLITSDADEGADDQGFTVVPLLRSGDNLPALIGVDPPVATFDSVGFGASGSEVFTVSNPGAQPLEVSRLGLSDERDAPLPVSDPQFEIIRGAGPTTVAPGASHTVEVRFSRAADDQNARFAALIIESNAASGTTAVYMTASPPRQQ